MAKYIGRRVSLGLGRETSRGVGVAPAYHLPKMDFSFDDKIVQARSTGSLGKIADSEEAFVTTNYGQGELSGEIRADSFGLLLYAALGGLSTAGPTDSAYTHSFSVSNTNQHQSLSMLVEDPNTTELYKLAMLESLEMSLELDQVAMFTASFLSKQAVGSGATMPAVTSEAKFTKRHLSFKLASSIAGLSGATAISLKSINFTINKNTVLDDVLGTAEPEDILNQQLSVEGQITLNYEDETYKNYMKDGTARAMEILFSNPDELAGGGSTPTSLKFQMPNVDFFDWEPQNDLDAIVTQQISFKANYDVANSAEIISTCDLVNAVASY